MSRAAPRHDNRGKTRRLIYQKLLGQIPAQADFPDAELVVVVLVRGPRAGGPTVAERRAVHPMQTGQGRRSQGPGPKSCQISRAGVEASARQDPQDAVE